MNQVKNAKLFAALALVFSITLVPATSAFAQETDSEQDQIKQQIKDQVRDINKDTRDAIKQLKDERSQKLKDLRVSISEEYKDRIKTTDDKIRPDIMPDREPDVNFDTFSDGWILIGGVAHPTSTMITAGNAYHIEGNLWKLYADDVTFTAGKRIVDMELVGKAKGHRLILHGFATLGINDDGTQNNIRVLLRGHFAPTAEPGHFAIAFNQFGYQTTDDGKRLPLIQVGDAKVYPNENAENPASFEIPSSADIEIFG